MTTIWSIGFQTKEGLRLMRDDAGHQELIIIGKEAIGVMSQPSRPEMIGKLLDQIKEGDTVLTPGGNTFELGEALLQRTAEAYWLPTQRLALKKGGDVPAALLRLWQHQPAAFYRFQAADVQVRRIARLYREFIQTEQERVAVANQNAQLLRRLRDDILLLNVSEDEFLESYVNEQRGIALRILRSIGQRPQRKRLEELLVMEGYGTDEIQTLLDQWGKLRGVLDQAIVATVEPEARQLYRVYTAERLDKKAVTKAEAEVNATRLKALTADEDEYLSHLKDLLSVAPFEAVVLAIRGVGPRVGAALVSHIRNPRMYPSVNHLLKYFNLLPHKGRRRTRFEAAEQGGAKFQAETDLWQWSHQMALFANPELELIYRACKTFVWLTYHDLHEISEEIFKHWGDGQAPAEQVRDWARRLYVRRLDWPLLLANHDARRLLQDIWGSGSGEELSRALQRLASPEELIVLQSEFKLDLAALAQEQDHLVVKALAHRLEAGMGNEKFLKVLAHIRGTGDWLTLKEKVVSRAGENIQMRPSRLDYMSRRAVAKQLVKLVYYQWLGALGEDINLFLEQDREYQAQCQKVGYRAGDFRLSVVGQYYELKAREQAAKNEYGRLEDIPPVIREACGDEELRLILALA